MYSPAKMILKHLLLMVLMGAPILISSQAVAAIGDQLEVVTNAARLRSLPSTKGEILKRLPTGTAMTELLRKGKWVRVSLIGQGVAGWMHVSSISSPLRKNPLAGRPDSAENRVTAKQMSSSLAELGYEEGILFEGVAANHARRLYFRVPQDIETDHGVLHIRYRFSSILQRHSNLRVYVNGSPRRIINLGGGNNSGRLKLKLEAADLLDRFVQVEIRSAMLISKDRCFDERIGGAFLHILPDTRLQWQLGGKIASVRSYWQLLPKRVKLSLPTGDIDARLFRNALGISQQLIRSGRQVSFTRMPEIGDIVIAPRDGIGQWLAAAKGEAVVEQFKNNVGDSNLALLNLAGKQFLAVMGEHDSHSMRFLSDDWHQLGASSQYRLYTKLQPAVLDDERYALKLQDLGFNTAAVEMSRQASWSATIKPSQLPPGHRINKVRLQLIAAPSMSDRPVMIYAYFNGVLNKAIRLEDSGQIQEILLQLPQKGLQLSNNLHIVAQRDLSELDQNCTGEPARFPIQIMPDSVIETVIDDRRPQRFADLPIYLSSGFDALLSESYLSQPEKILPYLASILSDMDLPLQSGRLQFFNAQETLQPTRPFILLGRAQTAFDRQAVSFDKGRIDVINQKGDVLLAVDALPKLSVAQLARQGKHYGLWILPPESGQLAPIKDMHLSKDDVAFADKQGILLTVDSSQPGLSHIEYPESSGWFDLFGEYRFWYFALGWLLLTSLIVYLYRLSRAHRK